MEETRNACKILVGKSEGKMSFGRPDIEGRLPLK
jgi:hypothetical protein